MVSAYRSVMCKDMEAKLVRKAVDVHGTALLDDLDPAYAGGFCGKS